jgi:hypothetical protein
VGGDIGTLAGIAEANSYAPLTPVTASHNVQVNPARMSEFVNYHKRGIELPPGCKDLIDVLAVTRGSQSLGRLSDVPRHVSMLVNSSSEQFTLMIGTTDERLSIVLDRSKSKEVSALVLVGSGAEHEKGIREFFQHHGPKPFKDYLLPGEDGAEVRGLLYPLPAGASHVSQIIADLLCSVYGFTQESEIKFRYYELIINAN